MTETVKAPPSNWEIEYWEGWAEVLPFPHGTVYDSRSYQDAMWNRNRLVNRQHNISLAHGRVNGQYLDHGNKRT